MYYVVCHIGSTRGGPTPRSFVALEIQRLGFVRLGMGPWGPEFVEIEEPFPNCRSGYPGRIQVDRVVRELSRGQPLVRSNGKQKFMAVFYGKRSIEQL